MINFKCQGRMISASKTSYRMLHPDHHVYFNANLCTQSRGKIWWGDLDLTLDEPELARLARELNEAVYVLSEPDGRDEAGIVQRIDRAVMVVAPA